MKKIIFFALFLLLTSLSVFAQDTITQEIYFPSAKSNLSSPNQEIINALFNNPPLERVTHIQITGHTDSIGTIAYNDQLSQKRVQSIAHYLIEKNYASPTQLITSYFGEKQSKYQQTWNKNRRVEITLYLRPEKQIEVDEDRTIVEGCLELNIEAGTFAPYKNSEVNFEIIELDEDNRTDYNVTLRDTNNQPLISGGMVYLRTTVNGKIVESKKPIKACIPAKNFPDALQEEMMYYQGTPNEEEDIIWTRGLNKCNLRKSGPSTTTSTSLASNKPCPCYEVTFIAGVSYNNCDMGICDPGRVFKADIPAPTLDADNVIWNTTQQLAIDFLDGKPKEATVLFTPTPTIDYVAHTTNLTNPPLFQEQKLHQDLVIQCPPNLYDSTARIRLFINKNFYDSYAPSEGAVNAENLPSVIKVYAGVLDQQGCINWQPTPYTSPYEDIIHCVYFTYDLPFTGFYKIVDTRLAPSLDIRKIKVRGPKQAKILAIHKQQNTVHYKLMVDKKHKRKFITSTTEQPDQVQLHVSIKRKKLHFKGTMLLSDLKYKEKKQLYIIRRRDLVKTRH